MDVILKNGSCDGDIVTNVSDACGILTRHAKDPKVRYKNTGNDDAQGRRIFEHWPRNPGEAESTEGVHDVE